MQAHPAGVCPQRNSDQPALDRRGAPRHTRGMPFRILAFFALAGFILLAPAYRQVFHGKARWLRGWQMYRQVGHGLCDASFALRERDGSVQRLNLAQAARYAGRALPARQRFKVADVIRIGSEVADRAGPDTQVLVTMRVIGRNGWQVWATDTPLEEIQARMGGS